MSKLVVNEEGFIDLRRNPPATTVTVQGGITAPEPVKAVPVQFEPPAVPKDEPLPAVQTTTEGLAQTAAPPVAVKAGGKPVVLRRIESADGIPTYAVVGRNQFERLAKHRWTGVRTGHMMRKQVSVAGVVTVLWFHREAAKCYRSDRFVAFLDGDERNCHNSNLRITATAAEAKALRREALGKVAHAQT